MGKLDIKRPFGTTEWAKYNENIIQGCAHDCSYCYAKAMAIRFKRSSTEKWSREFIRDERYLEKAFPKRHGRIMFPTTHDITPEHVDQCLRFLKNVLTAGNEVLIVTKPHPECIVVLCRELHPYKDQILFRFTIGSVDSDTLKSWEPNAPSFDERLASLR